MAWGTRNWAAALFGAATLGVSAASADSATGDDPYSRLSTANAVVLAVKAEAAEGAPVRLTVYDNAATFLELPASRHQATIGEDGLAVVRVSGLKAGDYSIVAYVDENGDGKLNRNVVGKPKEPYIFSNDVKPKLKKPSFEETKVSVSPGEVVVLTIPG